MKPTACHDCRHMMHRIANPSAPTVWYNYLCDATPLPPEFDPITGDMITREPAWAYCRDVNNGECPKFEPRP